MGDTVKDLSGISALEGYNGYNMAAYNAKAIEVAKTLNISYTGSDAHRSNEVGNCYTEFDGNVTYDNFLDRLREGRYRGVDTRKISRVNDPVRQF